MAKDLDILVIAPMEDTGLEAVLDEAAEREFRLFCQQEQLRENM